MNVKITRGSEAEFIAMKHGIRDGVLRRLNRKRINPGNCLTTQAITEHVAILAVSKPNGVVEWTAMSSSEAVRVEFSDGDRVGEN